MNRVFGRRRQHKECPKNNAAHQHYLNPKLSRRDRRDPDLTDYWIEIDTSKDIQTKNINNGFTDVTAYDIEKLNGGFDTTPKFSDEIFVSIIFFIFLVVPTGTVDLVTITQ